MGGMETDAVATFAALPRRLYLDTSVLHNIYEFGDVIWENEPFKPYGRAANMPGLAEDIEALTNIFKVTTRYGFEFVVTPASLAEVAERRVPPYLQWVLDVEDSWLASGVTAAAVERSRIGSISAKDWSLISEALDHDCDAFLTMDRPLASQSPVVKRKTGLWLLRPPDYWVLLQPWAALFY